MPDLMLLGKSGYEIRREIQEQIDISIFMVTVRTESIDKIRKLGIGDDKKNPKILKTVWPAGYRLNE